MPDPPQLELETIVETSLYCEDLAAMERFYADVMNLRMITREDGRHVFFFVGPGNVLLIFNSKTTLHGHLLPSHGSTGPGHVAFGIKAELLTAWKARVISAGIVIEKEQTWPKGGHSIYFRDPAGNSIELITPRVWGTPNGW